MGFFLAGGRPCVGFHDSIVVVGSGQRVGDVEESGGGQRVVTWAEGCDVGRGL